MASSPKAQVEDIAREFAQKNNPVSREVDFGNGCTFHFDNGHEEDTKEFYVVASLLVDRTEFKDFSPSSNRNEGDELQDNRELENTDYMIRDALEGNGFNRIDPPEFDKTKTNDCFYVFTYTLTF